ncbi:heterokaryon incompatibility protein-domain-containing protein [Dactylonectria macrodidyma]|uniref:Heterokaryon incompatibility protein-domain-containing protein n=1 Tax=Dactylonectria macrodidyma TaxID=307937 RepID=A0A9P9EYD7_9HYPO|nr:heterokaryon incompatibility protein-domain-containing protein [Dactylonectria macrodidyma]
MGSSVSSHRAAKISGKAATAEVPRRPFHDLVQRDGLPGELSWADKGPILPGSLPYTRLESDEIRLVILYAGDQSSELRLTTEIRKIEDAEGDYAAMSYVWGDPTEMGTIYVDRHEFAATKNLVASLHHVQQLLRGNETLPLWIDAICINQGDVVERNAQVSKMKQIYERSTMVITWLGETGADGLKYLDELVDWAHGKPDADRGGKAQARPILPTVHINGRYQEMKDAARIVANQYWKRVWTVQEYSSPRLGIFLCGHWWMDKSKFTPSLHLYMQALRVLRAGYEKTPDRNAFFVDATIWEVEKVIQLHKLAYARAASESAESDGIKRYTVMSMLLKFRDLKATNSLDKVFAPLCMVVDEAELAKSIPVDYSKSVKDIFTHVAVSCMVSDEWPLAILELCRFGVAPDLPSWVPDWRTLPRKVLSRDVSTGKQVVFASNQIFPSSSSPLFRVLDDDALQLEGIQVAALSQVWESMHSQELKDKTNFSIAVDDLESEYFVTGEKMSDAYRKTVNPTGHGEYPDQVPGEDLVLLTKAQWRTGRGIVARINRRRVAQTNNGLIGLAPAEAETTDEVWLIRGGGVLYVLRPVGEHRYLLIGESYFEGLMQGELAILPQVKLTPPQVVILV